MNSDFDKIIKEIIEECKAKDQPVRYDDIIMMLLSRQKGESTLAELATHFGPEEINAIHEALGDLFIDGMVDVCSIGSDTTCELTPKGVTWVEQKIDPETVRARHNSDDPAVK